MKKIVYVLLAFSFLMLFTGCDNNKEKYLKDLSYKELEEKVNNKEEFFFVVTRDGCSHCEEFIPVLEKILNDNKVVGYNYNLAKESDANNEKFDKLFNVDGTPTTIFVKDGKEVSIMQRINGNVSEDKVIQKLKNNGYIK